MTDSKTATASAREFLKQFIWKWCYTACGAKMTNTERDAARDRLLDEHAGKLAALGRPKVKKVRGTWDLPNGGECEGLACSGCGEWIDGDMDCIGEFDGPNYCHHCGGEFDGPLLCRVCGGLADLEFGDICAACDAKEAGYGR